jgi:hypothetical protein
MGLTLNKREYREHDDFTAEVIRTHRRKSAEIRVTAGAVTIRVPVHTSVSEIDELLHARHEWIREKVALQGEMASLEPRAYTSGEVFSYLGCNYRLRVEDGAFAPVKLLNGCLHVNVPGGSAHAHLVRNALVRWYKQRAHEKLPQIVGYLAPQVGAHPERIEIKSFKARWGSCSSTGAVQFNWRIMLAPTRMVEYVVVHELCHLLHLNHSNAYWREVERVIPDYRACRKWFKAHGWSLHV